MGRCDESGVFRHHEKRRVEALDAVRACTPNPIGNKFSCPSVLSALLFVAWLTLSACSSAVTPATSTVASEVEAVSLAAGSDGSLLWAERETGRTWRIDDSDLTTGDGGATSELVATVEVASDGQRGLLGIAEIDNRVYAAWTRPDLRLVVAEVAPEFRLVWEGPESRDGANGGRLLPTTDSQLLIGIGTLQRSSLSSDPDAPNGKVLSLNPLGPSDQDPTVVSGEWNNPFALTSSSAHGLWVADNHPGDGDERLMPGDNPLGSNELVPVTVLPTDSAPVGLASIDDRLFVCAWNTGAIYRYELRTDETGARSGAERAGTVATDCKRDVLAIDGRLFYAGADAIHVIDNVG